MSESQVLNHPIVVEAIADVFQENLDKFLIAQADQGVSEEAMSAVLMSSAAESIAISLHRGSFGPTESYVRASQLTSIFSNKIGSEYVAIADEAAKQEQLQFCSGCEGCAHA